MSSRDKNRDWVDAVRESLTRAEVEADDTLWSSIEQSLELEPVVASAPPKRPLLMAVAGVAATILVLLLLFMPQNNIPSFEQDLVVENEQDYDLVEEQDGVDAHIDVDVDEVPHIEKIIVDGDKEAIETHQIESEQSLLRSDPTEQECDERVEEFEQVKEVEQGDEVKEDEQQRQSPYSVPSVRRIEYKPIRAKREIAFLYSGGMGSSSASAVSTRSHSALSALMEPRELSFEDIYTDSEVTHHQPIGLGVRVQRELVGGLFLGSGLNYNLLMSEVDMVSGNDAPLKQNIHFIGVPLNLSYRFLTRNNISLYCGAGGGVEYCVAANVDHNSVDERRWHYSADVNVGIEYSLSSLVGLYFEPSVSHYFTTTRLKTIRNDSPTTFNIRLGVSFKL